MHVEQRSGTMRCLRTLREQTAVCGPSHRAARCSRAPTATAANLTSPRHDHRDATTALTPGLTAATARRHQQQTATMQLISTLALATSAAALVAPAAPKASTKLDVATLKNPSSTEFAYGLPGNMIPGVESSRFDFDPLGFAERASPAEMVKYREAELKHGRVAMLAITGMLFAEVWHPMLYAPSNVPAIFACGPSVLKCRVDGVVLTRVIPHASLFDVACSTGSRGRSSSRPSSRRSSSRSAPSKRRRSPDGSRLISR